jgi:hypothetical protein
MSFKVEYASRRREVWDYYRRAWRERLWKTHLTVFLVVSAAVWLYASESGATSPKSVLLALACGLLSILWFPIYPLLMFKPQMRTLEMTQSGISTTIGRHSAQRSWGDIRSVFEVDSHIIILGRNGNAFILPPRAFASVEERESFLRFAQSALKASSSRAR